MELVLGSIALVIIISLALWAAGKVDDYLWSRRRSDRMQESRERMKKGDEISTRLRSATDPADQAALIDQLREL